MVAELAGTSQPLTGSLASAGEARGWSAWRHTAIFFVVALFLIFCHSIDEKFDVDENVFVASGTLMRDGVLPYRDYHYNHMPTLVLIYSALFKVSDHLLLASRSFSVVCSAITAACLFHVALTSFATRPRKRQLLYAWGFGFLLLTNPLFTDVTGKAWNHDFPAAAMVLAFLAMRQGLAHGSAAIWMIVSGALLAISITSRLTFAPGCLGFLVFVLCYPGLTARRRLGLLGCVTLGGIVAVLPSAWIWLQAPENAFFGNFLYPRLNTRFHEMNATRGRTTFTLFHRVVYILWNLLVLPGNGLLVLLLIGFVPRVFRWARVRLDRVTCEIFALLVIIASLYAAVLVTAPIYRQYLYAPTPFMLLALAIVLGAAVKPVTLTWLRRVIQTCIVLAVLWGTLEYDGIAKLPFVSKWVPMQVHALGKDVAAHVNGGRVLTLSPIYPLEGGALIYEDLATGRFGLRVGQFLSEDEQRQYEMPDTDDVVRLFEGKHPDAVLITENEGALETIITQAARRSGYAPITLRPKVELWLPPRSRPTTDTSAGIAPATQP